MKKKDSDGAKKGSPSSVYLLFGDEYLVKTAARDLCAELCGPNEEKAALVVLDGVTLDYGQLVSEVFTPSLFCSDKVIFVEQTPVFSGKGNFGKLISKTCETWRSGEKTSSIRNFAQLCLAANIDSQNSIFDLSELQESIGSTLSENDKQTLSEVASAFLIDPPVLRGLQDDSTLIDLISSPLPQGVTLIFTASAIDKKKKLFKALEKHGQLTEFTPLQEKFSSGLQKNYFKKLVDEFLSQHGRTIAPDALNKVYERSGKDIRRIHSELEKIITFLGERTQITVRDVDELFLDFHEAMFFDFLTVLRTADIKKCLPALHDNLRIVAHPLQTLAAISSEFRKIIVARELLFSELKNNWKSNITYDQFVKLMKDFRSTHSTVSSKSKFNPALMKDYPLYLTLKTAQNYTMEQLTYVMESILEAETAMKSTRIGSVSPESVLQELVLKICSLGSKKRTG